MGFASTPSMTPHPRFAQQTASMVSNWRRRVGSLQGDWCVFVVIATMIMMMMMNINNKTRTTTTTAAATTTTSKQASNQPTNQRNNETTKQPNNQPNRQTDKQTDRQTNKQTTSSSSSPSSSPSSKTIEIIKTKHSVPRLGCTASHCEVWCEARCEIDWLEHSGGKLGFASEEPRVPPTISAEPL